MKTKITHTATPWKNDEHSAYVWGKGGNVCVCGHPTATTIVGYTEAGYDEGLDGAVANARHIVRCVNSHDALVALAKKVANLNPDFAEIGAGMLKQLVTSARAAIAQK